MKAMQLTLSLAAALAAMPAMAQDNGAPPIQIKFEVADQDPDFCLALVALENGTVPFMGELVLANAIVLVLDKQDGSFVCDVDLPMQSDADLWWQGVTWDMVDGLKILPIQKVAADRAETALTKEETPPPPPPLPIELTFLPTVEGGPSLELQATLIGPTSDYGLVLVHVGVDPVHADGGSGNAAVYLYRKVPGEGEGLLDIVEEHTVTADLSGAKNIRVYLGTGTAKKPGVATAWRLLTTLTP